MMKMDKLVVSVDASKPRLDVIRQAAALARRFHSELVMVHAGEGAGRAVLTGDPKLHRALEGIAVRHVTLTEEPAATILHVAHIEHASFILMYPHAYEAFFARHLSSVAAKVLYESECPVWTSVHHDLPDATEFEIGHVMCAVDFGPADDHTMTRARDLATAFEARLTLVHVTPSIEMYGPGGVHIEPQWARALVGGATARLDELAHELGPTVKTIVVSGDVAHTLSRVAEDIAADVIIVGGGHSAGAWRSNAYGIICQSSVPVLSG
jgi:nucleotide-binding universal stress UspA family protein